MGTIKLNKKVAEVNAASAEANEKSAMNNSVIEIENQEVAEVKAENTGLCELAKQDGGFVEEIKELRTANETVYRRNDRTCRKIITSAPTRYRDANGELKEISNRLIDNGAEIVNEANSFKVKFNKDVHSGKIFDLQRGDKKVALSAASTKRTRGHVCGCKCELCAGKDNSVTATLDDGTEIEYVTLNDRIKENIIIKERQESYEYNFTLNIGDMTVEEGENSELLLKDKETGETEFIIPAPYMYDANGKRSDKVSYEIDVNGNELLIKVVADAEFINAETRAFPVTIDPQIVADKSSINLKLYTEYPVYDEEQGWTEKYESDSRVDVSYFDSENREDGIIEYDIPQSYVDGVVTNVIVRLKCESCNGTVIIKDKICTPKQGEYFDVECGPNLKNSFYIYSYNGNIMSATFNFVSVTICYSVNKEADPQIKEYDLSGGVKGCLDVKNGMFTSVVPLISGEDFAVPLNLNVSHRLGMEDDNCGENWRLNLKKQLIVSDGDSEGSTKYCFKDELGNVKSFSEVYYYNDGDKKIFADKSVVTLNGDGSLTFENHIVYKYQFCNGYTLLPEISGFINSNLFEQRQDEQIQLEEYVNQMEVTLKSYGEVLKSSGLFYGLQEVTSLNYASKIDNINSIAYTLMTKDSANQYRAAYLNKISVEEQIVKLNKEIAEQNKEKETALGVLNDKNPSEELKQKYTWDYFHSVSKQIDSLNDMLSYANDQKALAKSQMNLLLEQADRNIPLVKAAFAKFFIKKAELERLLKQTPVNYLRDENGIINGFNRYGDLVLIADSYGNYVNVLYNDENRITQIYDNKDKAVQFKYANGLLQSITDSLGRQLKCTYDKDKQLKILTYPDGETLTFEYQSKKMRSITTSSGMQSKLGTDEFNRIKTISENSLPITISGTVTIVKNEHNKSISTVNLEYGIEPDGNSYTKLTNKENEYEKYVFTGSGRVKQHEVCDNNFVKTVKTYTYNEAGNAIKCVTQNDLSETAEETCVYDDLQRLVSKESGWQNVSDTVKTKTVKKYEYNLDGNLIQEITTKQTDVSGTITPTTEITNYSYNPQGSLTLTESYIDGERQTSGINYEQRVYDDSGNAIKTISWNSLDSTSKFYTESDRAENGQVTADRDETGETSAEYEYLSGTNVVNSVKYPNGSKLAYGRNPNNFKVTGITRSTADGEANVTDITYNYGLPVEVKSGNTTLGYTYDHTRRKTAVSVNGVTQATYTYKDYTYNTNQNKCTFSEQTTVHNVGNGETVTVLQSKTGVLDTLSGRIKATEITKIDGSEKCRKEYDENGRLTSVKNNGVTVNYSYDNYDNVTSISGGGITETYTYNEYADITAKTLTGAVTQTYSYTYKDNAARSLDYIQFDGYTFKPLTDVYGRNTGREIYSGENKLAAEYITYRKVGDHATNMPATMWFGNGGKIADSIKYKYDSCGNICQITENGHVVAKYTYDSLNRLIREDNKQLNKTVLFSYDRCGNITERCEYAYTLKSGEELAELNCTHYSYDYEGDRLKSYNGETFAYNTLGCPITYRGKTATWQYGKMLASYNGVSFAYDGLGRRISKNGITFTYDNDGRLINQSNGLEFIYDNAGVAGVKYNNTTYFYRKDVQGNIIAILDSNGAVVVKYEYDAWGNHTVKDNNGRVITSGIGILNPFRYRGYYYDTETELYYLQTRYYDPEIGRFISQDSIEYADPETINGLNLYAYCGNNPVNNVDPTGNAWWHWLLGAIIVVAAVALSVVTAGLATPISAALGGGMLGAVVGGAVAGAIGGAITGFGISIATQAISHGFSNINWGQVGIATLTGAVTGAILGGIGGGIKYARAASYLKSNGITDVKGTLRNFKGIPSVKTSNGTIGYRYYDGINALQKGRYLTNALTNNPVKDLVLYNNNATMVSKFVIQDGAKYLVGRIAGSQVNALQYFVANMNWLTLIF